MRPQRRSGGTDATVRQPQQHLVSPFVLGIDARDGHGPGRVFVDPRNGSESALADLIL
jgi:hypothetical protein